MKIILFNGPPSSGKDTAADFTAEHFENVYEYKMALPLKQACHDLLGLKGSLRDLEPIKELPVKFPLVDGEMSLRAFYIHLSENVMKPLFGKEIFGKLAVEYIKNSGADLVTISDSGFVDEAMPTVQAFGYENVLLIRVHREGKTFKGDSRDYIELPGVKTLDLDNNGSLEDFQKLVIQKVKEFIE